MLKKKANFNNCNQYMLMISGKFPGLVRVRLCLSVCPSGSMSCTCPRESDSESCEGDSIHGQRGGIQCGDLKFSEALGPNLTVL